MKEEGVKKVNMSILETEIDLITSIKNDFAIFENSSDLPVLDYPSRLEMGRGGLLHRGDNLVLCGFGGGLSSAACVLRW